MLILVGSFLLLLIPYAEQQIQNTKKNAHLSNARQYVEASRLALTNTLEDTNHHQTVYISIADLIKEKYISKPDIQKKNYLIGNPTVETQSIFKSTPPTLQSYVKIEKGASKHTHTYYILLYAPDGSFLYIKDQKPVANLTQDDVQLFSTDEKGRNEVESK